MIKSAGKMHAIIFYFTSNIYFLLEFDIPGFKIFKSKSITLQAN